LEEGSSKFEKEEEMMQESLIDDEIINSQSGGLIDLNNPPLVVHQLEDIERQIIQETDNIQQETSTGMQEEQ